MAGRQVPIRGIAPGAEVVSPVPGQLPNAREFVLGIAHEAKTQLTSAR